MIRFLLVLSFSLVVYSAKAQNNLLTIPADDPSIHYTGRVDYSNSKAVRFAYSGVSIFYAFEGTTCNILLKDLAKGNDEYAKPLRNFFNIIIDGRSPFVLECDPAKEIYKVDSLLHGFHTIKLFKRTEAQIGDVVFRGFQIQAGSKLKEVKLDDRKKLKMEFIGNSITCGYGNEGKDQNCKFSPDTENNYMAYGAITARNLEAEYVAVAYSGKGIYQNYDKTRTETLPDIYSRALPHNAGSSWDFSRWTPNIVIINLGTNDFAHTNPDSVIWVKKYVEFFRKIRANYPKAHIVCVIGPMMSDNWPEGNKALSTFNHYMDAIMEVLKKGGEHHKLHRFQFKQHTEHYGCDWHPGVKTHEQMAFDLTNFIQQEILNKHKME